MQPETRSAALQQKHQASAKTGIAFSKPTLTKNELKSVMESLIQDEISFGQVVQNLEKEFAAAFEFQRALSTISLHAAYHLSFMACNISENDEVIMADNGPVTALDALGYLRAQAVLVDIERNSFHPSVEQIISKISEKTKAIVLSYPYGSFHDYEPLRQHLASSRQLKGIKIIEDISYIAGMEHQGHYVGANADIAIVGLHEDMPMTIGKGAVMLTDSGQIFTVAKDLRYQGGSRPYRVRFDYTIADYQAAMAIEQLGQLSNILDRRRKIGRLYLEAVSKSRVETYFDSQDSDAYGLFPVITEKPLEDILNYFNSLNIEVRQTMPLGPLHNLAGQNAAGFPNSEKLFQRGVLIPIYPYLTKMNVERLTAALRSFY